MDLKKTFRLSDIPDAATMLTRVPLPTDPGRFTERGAAMAWAFPVVGALLGLAAGLVAALLLALGTGSGIAAVAAIATLALATGAMHEDGLADCADGFGGATTAQARLEIMRDSRIGAFGAVALILALLARWSGIAALEGGTLIGALIAIGAGSRAAMTFAMAAMLNARPDGLSATFGRPQMATGWAALLVALAIAAAALGWAAIPVFLATLLGAMPLLISAQMRIGGQTGDVLGAAQQCAEIAGLVAAVIVLA